MSIMTKASEIAPNVYLGPTPDPALASDNDLEFDVLIEASDLGQMPDVKTLESLRSVLAEDQSPTVQIEVPGSGNIMPPTWTHKEVDGLLNMCHWIWSITGSETSLGASSNFSTSVTSSGSGSDFGIEDLTFDADGDLVMTSERDTRRKYPRRVLIHCADGYTESSLLAITYFMFSHGLSLSEAWIRLHREQRRNFFAYPTDVALLSSIQPRILTESPVLKAGSSPCLSLSSLPADPSWIKKLDGSLPSRVLDYMYLGNLGHANNPALLKELGIGRVVSVGEKVNWIDTDNLKSDTVTVDGIECLIVGNVQDNGTDSLTEVFDKCLDFLGKYYHANPSSITNLLY
jgi:dual specificity MAP kinase phosphatase